MLVLRRETDLRVAGPAIRDGCVWWRASQCHTTVPRCAAVAFK
jgi:hypothetical protein